MTAASDELGREGGREGGRGRGREGERGGGREGGRIYMRGIYEEHMSPGLNGS